MRPCARCAYASNAKNTRAPADWVVAERAGYHVASARDGRRLTKESVVTKDSGPESAAKGIVEDVKGKAKEVLGEVTGDEAKEREGRAQQDKAQSQREVAEHEAKADAARSAAAAHEAEQRVHQDD
jgi:uncharacterized protein YjbJ (UPF0337 family)